ncbi:hypothetical protein [Bacillus cereus group sp. Bce018]|uniref:hypothetical protein n=1 Tax=Bacillus cereus group sp. Bce018 TaxID=3445248 RepID=UPI003F215FB0
MLLPISCDFRRGYSDKLGVGGSFQYNSDGSIVTTTSAPGTSNGAMKQWQFASRPGDVFEIEVWAKSVLGEGVISVDLLKNDNAVIRAGFLQKKVEVNEWRLYKSIVYIPDTMTSFQTVSLIFGVTNSYANSASIQYRSPNVKLIKSNYGTSQTIAMGLIRVVNGVADLHSRFKSFGVESLVYEPTNKWVVVKLNTKVNNDLLPIVTVCGTNDSPLLPQAGNYVNSPDPSFKIAFSDGKEKVNLEDKTCYAQFKVDY